MSEKNSQIDVIKSEGVLQINSDFEPGHRELRIPVKLSPSTETNL